MTSVLPAVDSNGNYKKVEVAKILGIGRSTLDNHIKEGQIKINHHRYTSRITIKGAEIIRFFNARM